VARRRWYYWRGRTARRAARAAREWWDVSDDEPNVCCATGADLLRVMSRADILSVDGVSLPITSQGLWFMRREFGATELELATTDAILQEIKRSRITGRC
jgi:hypothetical protein